MKVLFVFEFRGEGMMDDLMSSLRLRDASLSTRFFHGMLRGYIAGGTHPARVLNAVYMYIGLPVAMLIWSPDIMVIRSTPPGIQLWGALLGRVLRVPVACWLMDYHPEIEARALERRGFGAIARLIRWFDKRLLQHMAFIIVLDRAMESLLRSRVPGVPIVRHPTWNPAGQGSHEETGDSGNIGRRELCFAYAGNLGYAHPLETFERVIAAVHSCLSVRLVAIDASEGGNARLRGLANRTGAGLSILPRQPYSDLGRVFREQRADLGVVLLSDTTAGVVAPSKFSAYIRFGLPILYIGPPATSAHEICVDWNAGFFLRNGATLADIDELAARISDPAQLARTRAATRAAAAFFGSRNGATLARELDEFLVG